MCIFTSLLLVYVIDIELKFDEIRESTLLYLRAQTVVHVPKRDYLLLILRYFITLPQTCNFPLL